MNQSTPPRLDEAGGCGLRSQVRLGLAIHGDTYLSPLPVLMPVSRCWYWDWYWYWYHLSFVAVAIVVLVAVNKDAYNKGLGG